MKNKTETPSYITVHKRNLKTRGHASGYDCWYSNPRKPHKAEHWAYIGDDPDEHIHEEHGPYSYDGNHYVPMCRSHHRRHDDVVNKIMDCGCPVRVHMRTGCVDPTSILKSGSTELSGGVDGPTKP